MEGKTNYEIIGSFIHYLYQVSVHDKDKLVNAFLNQWGIISNNIKIRAAYLGILMCESVLKDTNINVLQHINREILITLSKEKKEIGLDKYNKLTEQSLEIFNRLKMKATIKDINLELGEANVNGITGEFDLLGGGELEDLCFYHSEPNHPKDLIIFKTNCPTHFQQSPEEHLRKEIGKVITDNTLQALTNGQYNLDSPMSSVRTIMPEPLRVSWKFMETIMSNDKEYVLYETENKKYILDTSKFTINKHNCKEVFSTLRHRTLKITGSQYLLNGITDWEVLIFKDIDTDVFFITLDTEEDPLTDIILVCYSFSYNGVSIKTGKEEKHCMELIYPFEAEDGKLLKPLHNKWGRDYLNLFGLGLDFNSRMAKKTTCIEK